MRRVVVVGVASVFTEEEEERQHANFFGLYSVAWLAPAAAAPLPLTAAGR